MCPEKKTRKTEDDKEKSNELTTTQYLVETIKQLQAENENMKQELKQIKGFPSSKIGLVFIIPGVLALAFSIINNSTILAFIGLGLTFWGALFYFIKPIKYVPSSLLDSTVTSTYTTIDRIVKDLTLKGKSYYIPPYPKEVYLPEYLKGLKETVVFISADTGGMPSIEDLAKSKFILKNPNGICVAPPGLGILAQFEKELGKDLSKIQLAELCENLPPVITGNLQLAKEVEMKITDKSVYLKILDSAYKNLYVSAENLKSVHFLGCPLVSGIACAVAKVTGRMVTIQNDKFSPDGHAIEVWYSIVEV